MTYTLPARQWASAHCLLGLAVLALAVGTAQADSIWLKAKQSGLTRSLYATNKASRVGDVVYVTVSETTTATSAANTDISRTSDSTSGNGGGLLSFLPFFSWSNDEGYKSDGTTVRKGSLMGRMTARLVEEVAPGVFRVEGSREVGVNNETQKMILSGIIRVTDIGPDNTIRSDQVADASICYTGVGPIAKKQKPGVLTRLFNWLF